jgi:hypothetical protein
VSFDAPLPETRELSSNPRPSTCGRVRKTREVAIFFFIINMQILTFFKWYMI